MVGKRNKATYQTTPYNIYHKPQNSHSLKISIIININVYKPIASTQYTVIFFDEDPNLSKESVRHTQAYTILLNTIRAQKYVKKKKEDVFFPFSQLFNASG